MLSGLQDRGVDQHLHCLEAKVRLVELNVSPGMAGWMGFRRDCRCCMSSTNRSITGMGQWGECLEPCCVNPPITSGSRMKRRGGGISEKLREG